MQPFKELITAEQLENCHKLMNYCTSGLLKAQFNMRQFTELGHIMDGTYEHTISEKEATECGSIGCYAGHGPYAGVPKHAGESWMGYTDRAFGIEGMDKYSDEWDWIFADDWAVIDNTPFGAAARMKVLLEEGLPNNWNEQMYGNDPLCYIERL